MRAFFARLKKKMKKWNKYYFAKLRYVAYCKKCPIDEKAVVLECQHGRDIHGNIFYILKELANNPDYAAYKLYVSMRAGKLDHITEFLDKNGIGRYTPLVLASKPYYKMMATAKYLINDNTFLWFFSKRDEQVYLNTWHGTPMKSLGKSICNDMHSIGNTQRNFVHANYLLYQNEFTREVMIRDYMLENLSDAKTLIGGYPRNTAFFDSKSAASIREAMDVEGKQLIAYMPTWRGTLSNSSPQLQLAYTLYYLGELDKRLRDDQIMYVNPHPIVTSKVNFSIFKKIREFPPEYETYAFLNAADVLITDYSSVVFDFAITKKKIILFTYDEEEYLRERGMYIKPEEMPFPRAHDLESLLVEIDAGKQYDETAFLQAYCQHDNPDATRLLCARVILGKKNELQEGQIAKNGKENVLIYAGDLAKNGITASFHSLISLIDHEKYNYHLTFYPLKVRPFVEELSFLSQHINYFPIDEEFILTLWEKVGFRLFKSKLISARLFMKSFGIQVFARENRRLYGPTQFSTVIQFSGYEAFAILQFIKFDANRVIYVHSDMDQEIKTRQNQRRDVLTYAYNAYDKIAIVTEDLRPTMSGFTKRDEHIVVANNIIDDKRVLSMAERPVRLDPETRCNVSEEEVSRRLESPHKKFITIGRYSIEKGHFRLIRSFDKLWQQSPDVELIIIGGRGTLYEDTVALANSMPCRDNITLLYSMTNPYAVLGRCDYFVLSSLYEGFGLVLAEADILRLPVVSTDIPGPQGFMRENGGYLVENSEAGVLEGLEALYAGKVKPLSVDYDAYNANAIAQFESLVSGRAL